jgi:hypothetical protein
VFLRAARPGLRHDDARLLRPRFIEGGLHLAFLRAPWPGLRHCDCCFRYIECFFQDRKEFVFAPQLLALRGV